MDKRNCFFFVIGALFLCSGCGATKNYAPRKLARMTSSKIAQEHYQCVTFNGSCTDKAIDQLVGELVRRKKIAKKFEKYVRKQELTYGMGRYALLALWGRPKKINDDIGVKGKNFQWLYGDGRYAYFENDKLYNWKP